MSSNDKPHNWRNATSINLIKNSLNKKQGIAVHQVPGVMTFALLCRSASWLAARCLRDRPCRPRDALRPGTMLIICLSGRYRHSSVHPKSAVDPLLPSWPAGSVRAELCRPTCWLGEGRANPTSLTHHLTDDDLCKATLSARHFRERPA